MSRILIALLSLACFVHAYSQREVKGFVANINTHGPIGSKTAHDWQGYHRDSEQKVFKCKMKNKKCKM